MFLPAHSGLAQATFVCIVGSTVETRSRTSCIFNMHISALPACMRSLHHLRTCSGTVLRNLPSVQWFVSAQVLQHTLATAPGRLQPISVPALATHAPTTARPLFIEPIHRTVLRYTFLPFPPFSSVFSLQMPELLAVLNEPNSLPHLVPGTPPFLSLSSCPHLSAPTLMKTESCKKRSRQTESCKKRSRPKVQIRPQVPNGAIFLPSSHFEALPGDSTFSTPFLVPSSSSPSKPKRIRAPRIIG